MMRIALLLAALVALAASAAAFVATPAGRSAVTSAAGPLEACRFNAKQAKAKRNQENMRKFRGKRGMASRKKQVRQVFQEESREREAQFMALVFQHAEEEESS